MLRKPILYEENFSLTKKSNEDKLEKEDIDNIINSTNKIVKDDIKINEPNQQNKP